MQTDWSHSSATSPTTSSSSQKENQQSLKYNPSPPLGGRGWFQNEETFALATRIICVRTQLSAPALSFKGAASLTYLFKAVCGEHDWFFPVPFSLEPRLGAAPRGGEFSAQLFLCFSQPAAVPTSSRNRDETPSPTRSRGHSRRISTVNAIFHPYNSFCFLPGGGEGMGRFSLGFFFYTHAHTTRRKRKEEEREAQRKREREKETTKRTG